MKIPPVFKKIAVCAAIFATASLNGYANSGSKEANFKALDKYAVETPKTAEKTPEKLAAYLMRATVTDMEKARVVARWLTTNIRHETKPNMNDDGLMVLPSNRPDSVFKNRRATDAGFAALFTRMMRSLGIETATITGWQKGFGYIPGDTTTLKRRVWSAFKSKGKWCLLDLPVYTEEENGEGEYRTKYADAFFDIAPEDLIYTHFPDDPKWQLLSEPISKTQFLRNAQYFGAYYGCSLKLLSHREYAISSKERALTMTFETADPIQLDARVYALGQNFRGEGRNTVKWTREGKRHTLTVKFSSPGSYKLELTASEAITKSVAQTQGTDQLVGYAVKTLAEYGVTIENKNGKTMASH